MSENNSKGFWGDPIEPPRLAYLNFSDAAPPLLAKGQLILRLAAVTYLFLMTWFPLPFPIPRPQRASTGSLARFLVTHYVYYT